MSNPKPIKDEQVIVLSNGARMVIAPAGASNELRGLTVPLIATDSVLEALEL